MTLHAGHCTACDAPVWRQLRHPKTGDLVRLWPDPTTHFAVLALADDGSEARGIAYCAAHTPPLGAPGPVDLAVQGTPLGPSTVIALQSAAARHPECYTDQYGEWLLAWTRELAVDHRLPELEFEPVRAQWRDDREAVVIHG